MTNYVSYLRVSTDHQGENGLGIQDQKEQISRFMKHRTTCKLLKEFQEVESGRNPNRPILRAAINYCIDNNCKLVVARLDRLYRDTEFLLHVTRRMDNHGLEIAFADFPGANRFMITILAAFGEYEARRNSENTSAALQRLKANGVVLGTPSNLTKEAREKGIANRMKAMVENSNNKRAITVIVLMRRAGKSWQKIADELQRGDLRTSKDKKFTKQSVQRLYNHRAKFGYSEENEEENE